MCRIFIVIQNNLYQYNLFPFFKYKYKFIISKYLFIYLFIFIYYNITISITLLNILLYEVIKFNY